MSRWRDERGQASAEYLGVILAAAVLVLALILLTSQIRSSVTGAIRSAVCEVAGAACERGANSANSSVGSGAGSLGESGGQAPPGRAQGPGAGDGAGRPGPATGRPPSSTAPYGPGSGSGESRAPPPCISLLGAAQCIPGVGYSIAQQREKLLARIHRATGEINRSGARTGTPEYQRLARRRESLVRQYRAAGRLERNPAIGTLSRLKKGTDPSANDILRAGESPAVLKPIGEGASGLAHTIHDHNPLPWP